MLILRILGLYALPAQEVVSATRVAAENPRFGRGQLAGGVRQGYFPRAVQPCDCRNMLEWVGQIGFGMHIDWADRRRWARCPFGPSRVGSF
jgi:hypothetical protein